MRPSSLFGKNYGVRIMEGPLAGLFARSVVFLSEEDQVIHAELVPEITDLPDFSALEQQIKEAP